MTTHVHYFRFMTPKYIKSQEARSGNPDGTDFRARIILKKETELDIEQDVNNYERIFKIPILKPNSLKFASSEVLVKYRFGLVYTGGRPPDPISFTVSDGDHAMGFQILDSTTYHQNGPYYPIEGDASGNTLGLGTPNIHTYNKMASPYLTYWPRVFEMSVNVHQTIGEINCAVNNGNMITAQFSKSLKAKKGLWLDVYRGDHTEHYIINWVEVTVTEISN